MTGILRCLSMGSAAAVLVGWVGSWTAAGAAESAGANIHRPVISPDGRRIVFMSDRDGEWELYLASIDGLDLRRLTKHRGWDGYAVWSPDGSCLIFDRGEDVDGSVKGPMILDLRTSEIRQLGDYETWVSVNVWVDERRMIGFQEETRDGQRDLVWIDADSGALSKITSTADTNEHDAVLAPDGHTLYFAVNQDKKSRIDAIDVSTGERRTVIDAQSERAYGLAVSPDGHSIAYTDTPAGEEEAELFLHKFETGETRRLTRNNAWDHMPVWTPDGKHLLFTSYRSGREAPYVIDPETGVTLRLYAFEVEDQQPAHP